MCGIDLQGAGRSEGRRWVGGSVGACGLAGELVGSASTGRQTPHGLSHGTGVARPQKGPLVDVPYTSGWRWRAWRWGYLHEARTTVRASVRCLVDLRSGAAARTCPCTHKAVCLLAASLQMLPECSRCVAVFATVCRTPCCARRPSPSLTSALIRSCTEPARGLYDSP